MPDLNGAGIGDRDARSWRSLLLARALGSPAGTAATGGIGSFAIRPGTGRGTIRMVVEEHGRDRTLSRTRAYRVCSKKRRAPQSYFGSDGVILTASNSPSVYSAEYAFQVYHSCNLWDVIA